jgi:hypothetical protein
MGKEINMKEPFRLGATFIIWAALTVILTSPIADLDGAASVFLILGAMGSTIAVWLSGINAGHQNNTLKAAEKSKRDSRDRLSRLIEQMDDDEIAQLGDLLSQNDDAASYNQRLSR